MLSKLADISVSVPVIMDLTATIGRELHEQLQQRASAHQEQALQAEYAERPGLATVAIDGGRIMTRAEGRRGVHEQAWKETKNACLLTMSSSPSEQDPHPELPMCFTDKRYVETLSVTCTAQQPFRLKPRKTQGFRHRLRRRGMGCR